MNETPQKSQFKCPLCLTELTITPGSVLSKDDGITLWCNNPHGSAPGQCPAQEVMGHGRNESDAFNIIVQKYKN